MPRRDEQRAIGVGRFAFRVDDSMSLTESTDEDFLRSFANDPTLLETLGTAAPDLYTQYRRWASGDLLRAGKLHKLCLSLEKYRSRSRSRATPFSTFAYVAPVFAGESQFTGTEPTIVQFHMPDLTQKSETQLRVIQDRLNLDDDVLRNNLVSRRGECFELTFLQAPTLPELELANLRAPIRVPASRAISLCLEGAAEPVSWRVLRETVSSELSLPPESLDTLITKLIASQFLVTTRYPVKATLPSTHRMDSAPTSRNIEMAISTTGVTLPPSVTERARRLADDLFRLSPVPGSQVRHEYERAFIERYGFESFVPVTDVVDMVSGLGPISDTTILDTEDLVQQLRIQELLSACGGSDTLRLSRDDFESLSVRQRTDSAYDFMFTVCGRLGSQGGVTLAPALGLGNTAPGALAGRFRADASIDAFWRDRLASRAGPGSEVIEVMTTVRNAKTQQVCTTPSGSDARVLYVGVMPDPGQPRQELGDIAMVMSRMTEQLEFYSITRGTPLVFTMGSTVHLPVNTPDVVRSLVTLSQKSLPAGIWNWGRLTHLPKLPRVEYRGNILARACWNPPLNVRNEPKRTWDRKFDDWCAKYRVPTAIDIGSRDNRLVMRCDLRRHRDIIRSLLSKPETDIREPYASVVPGEPHTANEWVIGVNEGPPKPSDSNTCEMPSAIRIEETVPDPTWLSVHIYLPEYLHDRFLTTSAPDLLECIRSGARTQDGSAPSWFFVRYRDPHPHVRVRVRIKDTPIGVTPSSAMDHLHSLTNRGEISRFAIVPYYPERSRYGGELALPLAEEYFCHESRVVLGLIRSMRPPDLIPAAATYLVDLARRAFGDDTWDSRILSEVPKQARTELSRTDFRQSVRLPEELVRDQSAAIESAQRWASALAPNAFARIMPSLMHMLHNRLFGINRAHESALVADVRAVALSTRSRRESP